jgi:hypothetical protein
VLGQWRILDIGTAIKVGAVALGIQGRRRATLTMFISIWVWFILSFVSMFV